MISFSSTQPRPSTQRRMILAGTPAITQRSGKVPRTTAPGGHDHVLPDLGPGQDDHVGPEPAPRSDAHARLGGPLSPDGFDRVLVGVVLVGDVHVGPGLDVIADFDRPVPDDVRPAADHTAAPDPHHRIGRHLLAGRHARA